MQFHLLLATEEEFFIYKQCEVVFALISEVPE